MWHLYTFICIIRSGHLILYINTEYVTMGVITLVDPPTWLAEACDM